MYTIERFFFMSLTEGAIALGWFSIIYSIITAIVCIFKAELSALFWYTFLGVGSGILLIIAVKKSSRTLLLPWLGVNAFHLLITTPISLVVLIWTHLSELGTLFGGLIYLTLLTLVIGYGWVGVYSLYLSYTNGNQNEATTIPRGQV